MYVAEFSNPYPQAIKFILSECANQSEFLIEKLGNKYNPCDIFSNIQNDTPSKEHVKILGSGDKDSLRKLENGHSNKLFDVLHDTVWKYKVNAFGLLVSFS
jgi:hypothetical protein